MEREKTAVEWLVGQLNKEGFAQVVTDEEIQQAKQMERGQIELAFIVGYSNGNVDSGMIGHEYYNKRYENKAENNN